jgi:hypothetical protein
MTTLWHVKRDRAKIFGMGQVFNNFADNSIKAIVKPSQIRSADMAKKLCFVFWAALISVAFIFSGAAYGFKCRTRTQIVADAVSFCPQDLYDYLKENVDIVQQGMYFVDRHSKPLSTIRPYDAVSVYASLVDDLKQNREGEFNTMHGFGVLASHVSETVFPGIPRVADDGIPEVVSYDGYHQVGDIHSQVSRNITNYREPYKGETQKEITDYLYNIAVNEIVDHWVSAWQAGGKDPGAITKVGREIKHSTTTISFQVNRA